AKGGGNIAVADGIALVAESGPAGTTSNLQVKPQSSQISVHVVKEGETISQIAELYTVSVNTIRWANDLGENSTLRPGDELHILPVDGVIHTVTRGQTLLRIAELYDTPSENIIQQNNLENTFILAGQELIIPGGKPIVGKRTMIASAGLLPDGAAAGVTPAEGAEKPVSRPAPAPVVVTSEQIAAADITSGVLQKPCSASGIGRSFQSASPTDDLPGTRIRSLAAGGGNIYAAEAGVVLRADYGWNGGYGNVVEIDHGNSLVSLYAHNKDILVNVGDTVQRGDKIASMGNTGRVYGKTGIHVHFEVRLKGVKKNPMLYIQ
ncbi:MAG: Peptidase M23 family protein, partial [Candidatus Peribacteria bacterium GW2011_GWB1_54_5]